MVFDFEDILILLKICENIFHLCKINVQQSLVDHMDHFGLQAH